MRTTEASLNIDRQQSQQSQGKGADQQESMKSPDQQESMKSTEEQATEPLSQQSNKVACGKKRHLQNAQVV